MSLKDDKVKVPGTGLPLDELPARVVIVEKLYHAVPGRNPTSIQEGFCRKIVCREQPYMREMRLTEQWVALDKGWIPGDVGLVYISVGPNDPLVQVGVAVREITRQGRYGDIAVIQKFSRILPDESIRVSPFEDELFLRKADGDSKKQALATVWVFPV